MLLPQTLAKKIIIGQIIEPRLVTKYDRHYYVVYEAKKNPTTNNFYVKSMNVYTRMISFLDFLSVDGSVQKKKRRSKRNAEQICIILLFASESKKKNIDTAYEYFIKSCVCGRQAT